MKSILQSFGIIYSKAMIAASVFVKFLHSDVLGKYNIVTIDDLVVKKWSFYV